MKYIKLYEDLDFDPNNFRKLRKDIKAITIELKDDGFKVLPFESEVDYDFKGEDTGFDFFVKIYRGQTSMNKWGFTLEDVKEYIEMIKDYIDNYYTYNKLIVYYDGKENIKYSDNNYYIKPNDRITQVEIEIGRIKKK